MEGENYLKYAGMEMEMARRGGCFTEEARLAGKPGIEKTNIKVNPTKCTGCLSCQLRCSLTYTGAFNPERARIVIDHILDQPTAIYFTDECIKNCVLCTRSCMFGAIEAV